MNKKYQVFVSSTYEDLRKERQEVISALLELDCIPAGMELFPAADDDQWTLIKSIIDECDYFVSILGGRYGTISSTGLSFTQREYEYAVEIGKPVIGFYHRCPGSIPSDKTEQSEIGKQKLEEFRRLIQKRMCKDWETPSELGAVVSRSIIKLIKSKPAIGWVRTEFIPDETASQEILRLTKENNALRQELKHYKYTSSSLLEQYSQGNEKFDISFHFGIVQLEFGTTPLSSSCGEISLSWDDIFRFLSPVLRIPCSEKDVVSQLNELIEGNHAQPEEINLRYTSYRILDDNFHTITTQLTVLGLIERVHYANTPDVIYWKLSPIGERKIIELRAIRRK